MRRFKPEEQPPLRKAARVWRLQLMTLSVCVAWHAAHGGMPEEKALPSFFHCG
jgi:hypothetical protein